MYIYLALVLLSIYTSHYDNNKAHSCVCNSKFVYILTFTWQFFGQMYFWLPQNGKDQLLHKTLYCSVPNKRVGRKICLFLNLLFEQLMLMVFVFKIDKHLAMFIQHTNKFILIGIYINKIWQSYLQKKRHQCQNWGILNSSGKVHDALPWNTVQMGSVLDT